MLKIYMADASRADLAAAAERLSGYRLKKAAAFKNPNARRECIAAGLLLDYALGGTGLREKDMEYIENAHGKPFFKNRPDIFFNLSHSGGTVVCALSDRAVGADVEIPKRHAETMDIAKRHFTESEYGYITNAEDPSAAFYHIWIRKESLLKALGTGISGGLGRYEVIHDELPTDAGAFYFSDFTLNGAVISCCARERAEGIELVEL